jgi:hypothetical protein
MKIITLASLIILSAVGICSTSEDECIPVTWYQDADGDGFGNPEVSLDACEAPTYYVSNSDDPDDENDKIFPGSEEPISENEPCDELKEFVGDVFLSTQKEVEDFGKKCIGKIIGDLRLGKFYPTTDDPITDLSPLANLSEVEKSLVILGNQELKSLEGLHALKSVNEVVSILGNSLLSDLKGLRNLEKIAYELEITDNQSLVSLEGLEKIKSTNSNLLIQGNTNLLSLKGLSGLEIISAIYVADNPKLENLKELKSIKSINSLGIYQNERFSNFFDENHLPETLRFLIIEKNPSLLTLEGLSEKTAQLDGYILIKDNKNLISLTGLYPNHRLIGDIEIEDNENLKDIKSLATIVIVERNLHIINNDQLTSLEGLDNVQSAGKTFPNLPNSPTFSLQIFANDRLVDLCAIQGLLSSGYAPIVNIVTNKYNPSVEDIKSGKCKE